MLKKNSEYSLLQSGRCGWHSTSKPHPRRSQVPVWTSGFAEELCCAEPAREGKRKVPLLKKFNDINTVVGYHWRTDPRHHHGNHSQHKTCTAASQCNHRCGSQQGTKPAAHERHSTHWMLFLRENLKNRSKYDTMNKSTPLSWHGECYVCAWSWTHHAVNKDANKHVTQETRDQSKTSAILLQ